MRWARAHLRAPVPAALPGRKNPLPIDLGSRLRIGMPQGDYARKLGKPGTDRITDSGMSLFRSSFFSQDVALSCLGIQVANDFLFRPCPYCVVDHFEREEATPARNEVGFSVRKRSPHDPFRVGDDRFVPGSRGSVRFHFFIERGV